MNELLRAVANDAAYRQLDLALQDGGGTVAVFGLGEAHRLPVNAALSEDRSVVWVVSTPAEALRLYEQQRAYRADTLLFLPRELPLVHLETVSSERRAARLAVLSRLALSSNCLIITCAEALMEKLAPLEQILDGGAKDKQLVRVAGLVAKVKRISTKKGDTMAFVTLEDYTRDIETIVFSDLFYAAAELFTELAKYPEVEKYLIGISLLEYC